MSACKNDGVQQKSTTVKKQVITVTENSSITSDATNTKEKHNSMHKDNSNTRETTCTDNSQTIKSAYSDEQIDEAKKVAINYYKNFPHELRNLKFKKVEGKKVMFQIYDETNQATRIKHRIVKGCQIPKNIDTILDIIRILFTL